MSILHFRRVERRRTARVALCVDLIVHGETDGGGTFKVDARTLSVSQYGGMMVLETEVVIGQTLLLVNPNAAEKVECRVVSTKLSREGKKHVAFEFTSDEVNFWKMCFPAAGAKPVRRTAQASFGALPAAKMAR